MNHFAPNNYTFRAHSSDAVQCHCCNGYLTNPLAWQGVLCHTQLSEVWIWRKFNWRALHQGLTLFPFTTLPFGYMVQRLTRTLCDMTLKK